MSGRDMRNFVFSHRTDESEKLVTRVTDGIRSNRYKAVDYDKLKAFAAEKKFSGQESLIKVKKLQQASKHGKEQHLIKQHKLVWQKEFMRLNNARKRLQAEIEAFLGQGMDSELSTQTLFDFEDLQSSLETDFQEFKANTVDPIWNLREDLQYWLVENQTQLQEGPQGQARDVLKTVDSVKQQQEKVLEQLHHEQLKLEGELTSGELGELTSPQERAVRTGIPTEAFDLECPSPDLKAAILQDFILLDEKHLERLEMLEHQHAEALRSSTGGWSNEDHYLFQVIQEQYTHDLNNRRMLYLDRMKRHMPGKTRAQLVAHEDWLALNKYYHERKRDLMNDWMRDRRELLNRAKVVFMEVSTAFELQKAKDELKERQKELCDTLYNQVRNWREQKLEVLWLEQQMERRRLEQQQELVRQVEEQEEKKRQEQRTKIQAYHEAARAKREEDEKREMQRLEELRANLAEQAAYDKQRVKFREDQLSRKLEELEVREAEKLAEEQAREDRLESLRQQVRPQVESDPERVWSETEAWQARQQNEEEININRPLFDVHGFSSKQVTADPRFRLEQRLREAGLHATDYGRHVLKQTQPTKAPRRDTESNVFK